MVASRLCTVLLALLAVGCANANPPDAPPTRDPFALRTLAPVLTDTGRPCMAAAIEGTLVRHPTSGLALRDSSGFIREVIWPHGHVARMDSALLALFDGTGTLIAHEGDRMELGGGEIDAGTWSTC